MMRNVNQWSGVVALFAVGCLVVFGFDGNRIGDQANAQSTGNPLPGEVQIGRFQIVQHPQVVRFQFLLDTATGRVWAYTAHNAGKPDQIDYWDLIARIDRLGDLSFELEYKANHGIDAWNKLVEEAKAKKP